MKNKKKIDLRFIKILNKSIDGVLHVSHAFAEHKRRFGLNEYEKIVFKNAMVDVAQASHKLLWLAVLSPQAVFEWKRKLVGCK